MIRSVLLERRSIVLAAASAVAASFAAPCMAADDGNAITFDIAAQSLPKALLAFSEQTDIVVVAPRPLVSGKSAGAARGDMSPAAALSRILSGTGLSYTQGAGGGFTIVRPAAFQEAGRRESGGLRLGQADAPSGTSSSGAASETVSEIDMIVVTATRREESLQDVPTAVTVVDPIDLRKKGFTDLNEVLAFVPGFQTDSSGPGGFRGNLLARGVGGPSGQSGGATVAVYIDDVPLSGASPRFANVAIPDGLLLDLERIEAVKGPQGTLYGATAVGGALRYITRKPSLTDVRGRLSAEASFTGNGGFNQLYSGNLSLPLVDNRVGLSLSGFAEDNDGFVDIVTPDTGELVEEDANAFTRNGVNADLLFQVTDRFTARFVYTYQDFDWGNDGRVTVTQELDAVFGEFANGGLPGSDTNQARSLDSYSVTLNYDLGWADITSITAYSETDFDITEVELALNAIIDRLAGLEPGTALGLDVAERIETNRTIHETRIASSGSDKIEWLVGLFYSEEDASIATTGQILPTGQFLIDRSGTLTTEEIAAFVNATYYFTPDLDISVGARLSDQSVVSDQVSSGPLIGRDFGEFVGSKVDTEDTTATYSFALRYRPTSDVSVYGRIASGYRPPIPNTITLDPTTGEPLNDPLVDTDKIWSYEAGVKGRAFDGMLRYDLALYYYDWDGYQFIFTPPGGIFPAFENIDGGVTGYGVEGMVDFFPTDSLSFRSVFAYSDVTLNEDEPQLDGVEGQELPYNPRWTFTLEGRYDFRISSRVDGYVGGGVRYAGERSSGFIPTQNIVTDAYVIADFNAGIATERFTVDAYIKNAFDKVAYSSVNFRAEANPVRPRTAGLRVSTAF